MTAAPAPLLVDFGGVLTGSLKESFARFGAEIGVDPALPQRLLSQDEATRTAFVAHEKGELDDEAFEDVYAEALRRHGADVQPRGLLRRVAGAMEADEETIALVARYRAAGHPVAIVTNSMGRDCYDGYDLAAMADVVVVSGQEGVRKPSRRIYEIACERLGVEARDAILVDDTQVNLDGAARLGIRGILHTDAASTAARLESLTAPGGPA